VDDRLNWDRDGRCWPHREASRFVSAGGLKWHVQILGQGPVILLIHGTGSSTHSWRRLIPLLRQSFTIIAPDLPGHGFTSMPATTTQLSLPGMAEAMSELLHTLGVEPIMAIGHSAGAAVAIRSTIDRCIKPDVIVSINGALLPFESQIGKFFSPLAKLLVSAPMVPQFLAWRARSRDAVESVLLGTGSHVESEDVDLYARIFRNAGHVSGALGMMANWDLSSLAHDLPRLSTKLVLINASNDKAIAPSEARGIAQIVPNAEIKTLKGLGHLAHEERPDDVAKVILAVVRAADAPSAESRACG
jgi:magnesium chelatase accessory protein